MNLNPDFGKVPPQATDIEQSLLGICLVYKDTIYELRLIPEMFYRESHQKIFKAISDLISKGLIADLITVTEELRNQNELDAVGGPLYLTQLTMNVFSEQMAGNYALIIREKYIRREYIRLCSEIMNQSFDESNELSDVIEFTETGLFKLSDITQLREAEKLSKLIGEQLAEVIKVLNREVKLTGVPSKYTKIDRVTGGWQQGNLVIIASRPSMGKTALALNLALNSASLGYPVGLFSLEMSRAEMAIRSMSFASGYSNIQIRNADLNINTLTDKSLEISPLPLWIDDSAGLSLFELRSKVKKLVVKKGARLIIVDYMQLMKGEGKSREEEVACISRGLKSIAKEFNIPVIALSQLNRKVEDRKERRPVLSDLRESGSIEQDADLVLLLWRPAYYNIESIVDSEKNEITSSGLLVVEIAKNRNGATGDFNLFHNEAMSIIQDVEFELHNLPY